MGVEAQSICDWCREIYNWCLEGVNFYLWLQPTLFFFVMNDPHTSMQLQIHLKNVIQFIIIGVASFAVEFRIVYPHSHDITTSIQWTG